MSTISGWEILVETAVQCEVIKVLCGQWGIVRERPRISVCSHRSQEEGKRFLMEEMVARGLVYKNV